MSQPEKYDLVVRVLSVTGLYLSHALPNVSDYEEPVPEPQYRCAPDEKLPQAQGYIWGGMRRTGSAPQLFGAMVHAKKIPMEERSQ